MVAGFIGVTRPYNTAVVYKRDDFFITYGILILSVDLKKKMYILILLKKL